MKNILAFLLVTLFVTACCKPTIKEVIVHDTVTVDKTCYPCIDSARAQAEFEIDSLYRAAMQEVTDYREQSIYQVDTLRKNFFTCLDSIKKLYMYDNMFVPCDSLHNAELRFDSVTGKPYIKI